MKCPPQAMLLRLVSGELDQQGEESLRRHVQSCPACVAALKELGEAWQALGQWPSEVTGANVAGEVLERVAALEGSAERRRPSYAVWPARIRAAAAILIAVGLGVGAGELIPLGKSATAGLQADETAFEAAADGLGVTDLAIESATGLSLGFSEDTQSEAGEEL